jgi:peptidyl-prolyl cis-trans isomerase A (cyclophilin A)
MAFVCIALGVLTAGAPTTLAQSAASGAQTSKPAPKPTEQSGTQTAKPPAKPAGQSGAKPPAKTAATAKPAGPSAALKTPSKLKDIAPATYKVNLDTSAGPVVIEVTRAWAPKAADRFYNLVKYGFYDGDRFFRVVPNFMVQFGMHGDPKIQAVWQNANIPDEPTTQSNKRGYITFANAGPNTRSTQVFINFKDNTFLDTRNFTPFGQVATGMEFVDKINAEYGERPEQGKIAGSGNAYLNKEFPRLDYIKKATIVK